MKDFYEIIKLSKSKEAVKEISALMSSKGLTLEEARVAISAVNMDIRMQEDEVARKLTGDAKYKD